MKKYDKHIRYRIYVQTSDKPTKNYPKRLPNNLNNLHKNITRDPWFWEIPTSLGDIKTRTFIPQDYKNVNKSYYYLIAYITEYFDCLAIWDEIPIKGTINTIRTFTIIGPGARQKLSYHYTSKIINGLNNMRHIMTQEKRRKKYNLRHRGKNSNKDSHSSKDASMFFYKSLDNINTCLKDILEDKRNNSNNTKYRQLLLYELDKIKNIDFKAYNISKPTLKSASCRPGKFHKKRIITVF